MSIYNIYTHIPPYAKAIIVGLLFILFSAIMIRVYIFFADFFFICINKLSLFLKKSVNNTETSNTNSSSNTVTKKDSSYNSSGNNTLKRKNTFNYGSGGGDGDGEDGDKRKRKLTRYNKPRLAPAVTDLWARLWSTLPTICSVSSCPAACRVPRSTASSARSATACRTCTAWASRTATSSSTTAS